MKIAIAVVVAFIVLLVAGNWAADRYEWACGLKGGLWVEGNRGGKCVSGANP